VLTENRRAILAKPENKWRFKDRLIRSLVRLKRLDDVLRENRALKEDTPDPWYATLILALAGDVGRVEQNLQKLVKQGHSVQSFYDDPDLGPALRSERFAKLRAKYPEPKEKAAPKKPMN
jgi:hypothetical protein